MFGTESRGDRCPIACRCGRRIALGPDQAIDRGIRPRHISFVIRLDQTDTYDRYVRFAHTQNENRNFIVSWNHTLQPTLINEFRYMFYNRRYVNAGYGAARGSTER